MNFFFVNLFQVDVGCHRAVVSDPASRSPPVRIQAVSYIVSAFGGQAGRGRANCCRVFPTFNVTQGNFSRTSRVKITTLGHTTSLAGLQSKESVQHGLTRRFKMNGGASKESSFLKFAWQLPLCPAACGMVTQLGQPLRIWQALVYGQKVLSSTLRSCDLAPSMQPTRFHSNAALLGPIK